ncbi:hypothetical protein DFH07DRAFT_859319 [Mycena maculata]|uniref:F-box domain-containing protein n=1 Tax=Mycena maculata TaxID=230809 RepID=A0AAD7HFB9_9AGAR|nr:hypothetical protein DFH07DRAFT_859319 [Mycena maculata]
MAVPMADSEKYTRAMDRAQLDDIESQIRALRSRHDLTKKRLESYKYPVLTLPSEIVSEIFVHFLPVYPLCPPQEGLLSPTLLTHICQKWREIALGTPALWRAISLRDDIALEQQIHLLETWLSRSGCCPLSIHMEDYELIPMDEYIEAIVPHRARLEYARFHISLSGLRALEGVMPLLRQLSIRLPYDRDVPPSYVSFHEVPRLRAVTLWDFTFTMDLLPWSQLTSLTLVAKTPSECTPVLKETTNLIHCKLITGGDAHVPQPDTHLPYLETLVFVHFVADEDPATEYLDAFIAPALRRLQIPETFLIPHPYPYSHPCATLRAFIAKSGCNPHEIFITGAMTMRKSVYRKEFPTIKFTFNTVLTDSYCDVEPDSPRVQAFSDEDWYP